MKRGTFVAAALPGDFGKPRPALVIQSDRFAATATLTILLVSGTILDAPLIRITVEPTAANGLRKTSQIMIDKVMTIRRERLGEPFGQIDGPTMIVVDRSLAVFFGIA